MNGQASRDLSELAYHIVNLCSFWRRTESDSLRKHEINVLSKMIGICLGIRDADRIARAVVSELDSLTIVETDGEINPDGIEVVFVSTLLQEQIRESEVPAATAFWSSVFEPPIKTAVSAAAI